MRARCEACELLRDARRAGARRIEQDDVGAGAALLAQEVVGGATSKRGCVRAASAALAIAAATRGPIAIDADHRRAAGARERQR